MKINNLSEKKMDELYNFVKLCWYCNTPFKDCDTIVPGSGVTVGSMDVVRYKNRFWHYGCIFDYEKEKSPLLKKIRK